MRILTGSFWLVTFALTMARAENNVEALHAVSLGANQFSSSLFQAVIEEKPGNLIISPLSAGIVLAMAAFGARGKTESQFRTVLHLPSPDSLATCGYQALIDNLNNVHENKLALANKAFIAENFNINSSYKDLTQTYFRSVTQSINFAKSLEAVNIINRWVEQNTNNLIQDIINTGDIDDSTALVLINAVYFKGQWKNKFSPDHTKNMPFNVNKNTVKQVPTMYRQGTYKYGELANLNAKFIVIPYKGDELSMVIILPNEIDGLAEVEKKLQTTSLTDILNQGFEREIQLYLPKFKIESKIELNNILQKMGLIDAFSRNANFSGISDEELVVTKVVQKAFIEVNEEGSEATAVTEIEVVLFLSPSLEEFRVNGPFFFAITSRNDNTILFEGRIIDFELIA
ncbi:PREDICTED: antichymotrypsin-2-like isoform X3 [Eufriesea mexicana]|uniref:antichymotrypsin-2-like isoform X3 n=1 Tax=Eufriesea mexicana TaxID=516756 RepID=UPI00083C6D61|nr:PREDICTED: antichymotrypsin-2-like isoform X3 [Eufriesea mexicana]